MKTFLPAVAFVVLLGLALHFFVSAGKPFSTIQCTRALAQYTAATTRFVSDSTPVFACDTTGLQTVPGYHFMLEGDFNGDGKKDQLIEHFTDGNGKETGKYFIEDGNIWTDQCLESMRNPNQFFAPAGFKADSLPCPYVCFAQNLGDLDGNGSDEVGFVGSNNDYSSLSSFQVYTLRKGQWQLLLNISVWEWMFPPTPETAAMYYPFGHMKDTLIQNDSLNRALEAQLKSFSYIKKIRNNVIEFDWRNDTIESPYITVSSQVTVRYDLRKNTIKIKLPEEMVIEPILREMDSLYTKTSRHEYRVGNNIYFF